MAQIHKTAEVSAQAEIAENVTVGAYSIIGPGVKIDSGSSVAAHVVISRNTSIGRNNKFFQFSSVGDIPQDKKYRGEETVLTIGDDNTFREFCSINAGTNPSTSIGHDNLFMAYTHVAHDCVIGDGIVFVNNATLGGHVYVDNHAVVGAAVKVHQFCRIGEYSLSRDIALTQDLAPYVIAAGYPARTYGLNKIGLRRAEFDEDLIAALDKCYKKLVRQGVKYADVKEELAQYEEYPEVKKFIGFIENSMRGILH